MQITRFPRAQWQQHIQQVWSSETQITLESGGEGWEDAGAPEGSKELGFKGWTVKEFSASDTEVWRRTRWKEAEIPSGGPARKCAQMSTCRVWAHSPPTPPPPWRAGTPQQPETCWGCGGERWAEMQSLLAPEQGWRGQRSLKLRGSSEVFDSRGLKMAIKGTRELLRWEPIDLLSEC